MRSTSKIRVIPDVAPAPTVPTTVVIPTSPPSDKAVVVPDDAGQRMSSRALVHYRKAEAALRRGDLIGAVLQLKMAIASDPQSMFLRCALTEVEAGVTKKP
jgi:hypothetical protein